MTTDEIKIFDGVTFDADIDGPRLTRQLDHVRNMLLAHRGEFFTLGELRAVAGGSEAGISARIRDLRKARNGGHDVQRRRRDGGLWEYGIPKESS